MISPQNPIVTWAAELDCNDDTRLIWAGLFTDPDFAAVRQEPGEDGNLRWFLRSARFDGIPDTEIHRTAENLLALLNGAVQVRDSGWKVKLGRLT